MREILFRGKRLDNGMWVYGYYVGDCGDGVNEIVDTDAPFAPRIEVDPATVGQYTGLTDRNGVKIFEGDICDFAVFDYNDNDTQYRGVVVYDGSRFMLWKSAESEFYGNNGGFDLDWVRAQDDEFEIVGNYFDNPELLKEAEQ